MNDVDNIVQSKKALHGAVDKYLSEVLELDIGSLSLKHGSN